MSLARSLAPCAWLVASFISGMLSIGAVCARAQQADGEVGPALTLREAVQSALRNHPAIALARNEVAARTADVLAARAPLDPSLRAELGHSHDNTYWLPGERVSGSDGDTRTDTTALRMEAAALLPWGLRVTPSVGLERAHTRGSSAVLESATVAQRARAAVELRQSLLRGRGVTGTSAGLHSAERARDAAEHSASHEAQVYAYGAIVAYYAFVGAHENVLHFQSSLVRAGQLFEETRQLVEADQRSRADLRQVEASRESQASLLSAAQESLSRARYELALAMGLGGNQLQAWVPDEGFPAVRVPALVAGAAADRAVHARRDLEAAHDSAAAATMLVEGAERNALPALDLTVSIGYTGALAEDGVGSFFASAFQHVPGLDASATLSLELPFENAAGRGELELRRAQERGARIAAGDIERQVRAGVRSALDSLQLTAAGVAAAQRALDVLRQLVTDEREKLREGLSTIIDVVLTEERLTQAQLALTAREQEHTLTRARLQYERGALPDVEQAVAASGEAMLEKETGDGGR